MVINSSVTTLEERIEACLQCSLSSQLTHIEDLPIWILWRLWKSRNTLMFQQRTLHWKTIIRYAKDDVREWKQNGSNEGTTLDNRGRVRNEASISHWKRPPGGWIKCNTDGTFHHTSTSSSAGWVFRDTNGTYSGSAQARGRRVQDALESEMQAILMALQNSWSLGHQQVIVESDCQKAIEILINKTLHFGYYNWTQDIKWWSRKFQGIRFQWSNKSANKVADKLAKNVEGEATFSYFNYVPLYLTDLLHLDHLHSS